MTSAWIAIGAVAELVGQRLDAIDAPGQQRDAMAVGGQRSGGRLADARRGAGDDRDAAGACSRVLMLVSSFAVELIAAGVHCRTDRRDLRGPVRGVLTGHPSSGPGGVQCERWTPSSELSQFLTSRRAKVTPEQAGLPTYGQRRVPGLRREEVASLAGVSVEYYKRLERGNATGASDSVLDALADALRLDDAERAHLFDLARAASPIAPRQRRRPVQQRVRPVGAAASSTASPRRRP